MNLKNLLVRTFLSVRAKMFFEITQSCKEFRAVATVERLTIVQAEMGAKTIPGVESFFTVSALKRLDFRVDSNMNLQRVRSKESLAASLLGAFEAKFT